MAPSTDAAPRRPISLRIWVFDEDGYEKDNEMLERLTAPAILSRIRAVCEHFGATVIDIHPYDYELRGQVPVILRLNGHAAQAAANHTAIAGAFEAILGVRPIIQPAFETPAAALAHNGACGNKAILDTHL